MALATSKQLQEKVKIELGEDPKRIQEDINYIREWLNKQPHLSARTDDRSIQIFLRGCKYNLEKTKQKIDCYYASKTLMPEFFSDRNSYLADIHDVFNTKALIVLPKSAGPAEPKLILCRVSYLDPDRFNIMQFTRVVYLALLVLCMEDPNASIAGISFINDVTTAKSNYRILNQVTPTFLKKSFTFLKNSFPLRLKAVYYVNTPSYFEMIYNLMKLFAGEKLKERIKMFSKMEDIYSILPKSLFPRDYGGDQPSCDELCDEWVLKMESYRSWFEEDAQYGSDESKRPKDLNNVAITEMFGLEGSFRKLDID